MGINRISNYTPGVTETYQAYVTRINSPKKVPAERQVPVEYKVHQIGETVRTIKYDSRGNAKRYTNLGGIINELA